MGDGWQVAVIHQDICQMYLVFFVCFLLLRICQVYRQGKEGHICIN